MTKNNLIKILSENQQEYVSGEWLAETLGVSRNAIWKGINSLKASGFEIEAIRNKGYRLGTQNDVLSSEIISGNLENSNQFKIECEDVVSSTNLILKQRYLEDEGLVVVANSQEAGIGRMKRDFYSPKDTGIYFSILLKPNLPGDKTHIITSMAGIAVCRALEKLLSLSPKIKWVNDIYLDDKKVCGILTEGSFSLESNTVDYIILGIGMNVYDPILGFPQAIQNVAGSVIEKKQGGLRNRLVAEILNEFWAIYENPNFETIANAYRTLKSD